MTDFYDRALRPVGITTNQYFLLASIRQMEGCGSGELAQRAGLEKSTLVRTLQPLLREGLIVDKSPPKARKRQLYLTVSGKEVFREALPLWRRAQDEIGVKLGRSHDELMEFFNHISLRD
ncbi:MAG: MarR family winged helix-turn-helix transcriptional regulator [Desulfarculales bacterium]|nr:MarR family winged helix-turn-helix transcriptional regulator [Desulfarculales bacterium]